MMTTRQVADELVSLCKQGQNEQAIQKLYCKDIVSVEAYEMPGTQMPREMRGLQAIEGKTRWWIENHEIHNASIKGPFMHGDDRFGVIFNYDVTYKPAAQRMQMEELGVYTVANGKVVREEFYYTMDM